MRAMMIHVDSFLRGSGPFSADQVWPRPWWWLPAMVIGFGSIYGMIMGTFDLGSIERLPMLAYGGIKVPLLLLATTALCLPVFVLFNTILGLGDDLREATEAILAGQAGLSIALASLSPVTALWYLSSDNYTAARLFNMAAFTAGAAVGGFIMWRCYRRLIRRNRCHHIMLAAWLCLYAFVGIQMGWTLRPFIGNPGMPVSFFRQGAFTNAYLAVARIILGTG